MNKEDFLNKWIDALPLNSKDSDRKEMEYDLMQLQQPKQISDEEIEEACYEICGRNYGSNNLYKRIGFWACAKWMREKLKNQ